MCNDNLNLAELLGNCPKGIMLYSPIVGEIELFEVMDAASDFPIRCLSKSLGCMMFTAEGKYTLNPNAECVLFPSKERRDWSRFNVYEEGDILTDIADCRAFILKGYTDDGYPIAYGGLSREDRFIFGNSGNGIYSRWTSYPCRRATPEEINVMIQKMKEAGYIWCQKSKTLIKDLPIDTLVIVSESTSDIITLNRWVIRRYAGKNCCFNDGANSICNKGTLSWKHIVPLNKFTVVANGIVEFKKEDDYGTANF